MALIIDQEEIDGKTITYRMEKGYVAMVMVDGQHIKDKNLLSHYIKEIVAKRIQREITGNGDVFVKGVFRNGVVWAGGKPIGIVVEHKVKL